ncbi:MAG TPA: hypothetical protein EYP65_04825 [Armatimonadetes bacterium]|nr:hypothetical protein [Armatimonadota bacterium]
MLLSRAVMRMCEGELEELAGRWRFDLDIGGYVERVRKKTGSLMGACCVLGAMATGAEERALLSLERFGELVGAAFQAVDDLLDLFGSAKDLGKPVGVDILAGKESLPVVLLLSGGDRAMRERALRLLRSRKDKAVLKEVARIAVKAEVPRKGLELARGLVEEAKGSLHALPDSPGRRALEMLADLVVERGRALLEASRG